MNLLLDTQIFLWYIAGHKNLPVRWLSILKDPSNQVFLSVVSFWEICVKYRIGKLSLPETPLSYVPRMRAIHSISSLALDERAVKRLLTLPDHHRDPFDLMLICQAQEYDLTLATVDQEMLKYPVTTLPIA